MAFNPASSPSENLGSAELTPVSERLIYLQLLHIPWFFGYHHC